MSIHILHRSGRPNKVRRRPAVVLDARAGRPHDGSPDDPLTIVAIVAIVVIITLVASYVPARRALRIEPTEALRAD